MTVLVTLASSESVLFFFWGGGGGEQGGRISGVDITKHTIG